MCVQYLLLFNEQDFLQSAHKSSNALENIFDSYNKLPDLCIYIERAVLLNSHFWSCVVYTRRNNWW